VLQQGPNVNDYVKRAEIDHTFPPTKLAWVPDRTGKLPDLLATTGDYLRLWELSANGVSLRGTLSNQVPSGTPGPGKIVRD